MLHTLHSESAIMNYGRFDDKKREYVITNPRTPTKWINYIGTLAFGGYVDHTGGALICAQDPALNRITKYITQFPASAFNGETLYLRIKRSEQSGAKSTKARSSTTPRSAHALSAEHGRAGRAAYAV